MVVLNSLLSKLNQQDCLRYVINLAVIDCLVGKCDRHTKNLGLFCSKGGRFSIPLIFDNGMGLFEHDCYRDSYISYSDAMRKVYVSPYGEDPFDMWHLLQENFDLSYLNFKNLQFPNKLPSDFAKQYVINMFNEVKQYERAIPKES